MRIKISKKSEALNYFKEYQYSESDDIDTVQVYMMGVEQEMEGKSVYALLETFLRQTRVSPGTDMDIRVFHDCPGCCRARREKTMKFSF